MNYFQKLYSGRVGRKSYILGTLLLFFISSFLLFLEFIFLYFLSSTLWLTLILSFGALICYAIIIIIFWIYSLSLCMRRLHDMGKGRWWLVISVLPLINLWLVFQKGDEKKNQYGDAPLKDERLLATIFGTNKLNNSSLKGNWFKVSLLIIIIVIIGGAFYWYSYRPSQIIKMCQKEKEKCQIAIVHNTVTYYDLLSVANGGNRDWAWRACNTVEKETKYNDCLRENGLGKNGVSDTTTSVNKYQDSNATQQITKEPTAPDNKADDYIITYSKDGDPVTWEALNMASVPIMNDTLSTYKTSLPVIKTAQDNEKEIRDKMYSFSTEPVVDSNTKQKMQTLINYEDAYISSGDNVIEFLNKLIKNYPNLLTAIKNRNQQSFLYYSDVIDKLEGEKASILSDYSDKQSIKQNFAESIGYNQNW